ncbi:MAG TPA: site-specific integrase [Candidatus Methylomirabilis sp.]|nr:site-specific integrase [Candidatus Methylomirabilis sp.]
MRRSGTSKCVFRKPKEGAPRQGFFEAEQYQAVRRRLPEDLQVAVAIAYTYGWRMQSEVLTLQRRQLDLETGTLRLEPGTTKNDEGRVVYLTPELKAQLAAQVARVDALQRRAGQIIPFLFPHPGKGRRAGHRRKDFRKAWTTACEKAGVPGMHRHDFRRTAVRNMVNRGVPERVAMKITGHKTRAVFDRYHIVSPGEPAGRCRKLAGTIPGTVTSRSERRCGRRAGLAARGSDSLRGGRRGPAPTLRGDGSPRPRGVQAPGETSGSGSFLRHPPLTSAP